jgi:hypothetical protein
MFGPYRLDGLLGRGGMGEVHRAYDTRRGRAVALKLLLESFSADPGFRDRFQREAAITAKLRDPHVIPIHDYGEIDGRLYLDMRLVDGTDLATVLARDGALPAARAVGIVEQVAAALAAAHANDLVHRDVKPSNVLVSDSDFCYLADFGIARAATGTRMTATGMTVGTFEYMAPERFLHLTTDHRVDVYSLACMLYECLTRQRPFPGDELAFLFNSHLNVPPPKPSERVPDLPAELDVVIARGMAKDPGDRYPITTELAAAARAALVPIPAVTAPVTPNFPVTAAKLTATGPTLVEPPAVGAPAVGAPAPASPPAAPAPAETLVAAPETRTAPPTALTPGKPRAPSAPGSRRRRRWRLPLAAILVAAAVAGFLVFRGPTPIVEGALTGHTGLVSGVATATLDGQPIAVSTSDDKTLRIWDLHTHQQIGTPLTGHTGTVRGVATTTLDGRPVAISAGGDDTVRVWDLHTHQQLGAPLTGHTSAVFGVATTTLDGRPVAISASNDDTLRVWDLHTHRQLGDSLTGHTGPVDAVTTTTLDGQPIAISASADSTVRIWDLRTHRQLGAPLTGHTSAAIAIATTELDGRPVAVSAGADTTVRIWDLRTHRQLGTPLTGHTSTVDAVTTTTLDGQPIAVSAGYDASVRIWDLHTHRQISAPLTGHTGTVDAVTTTPEGQPIAISAGADTTLHIWDLTERAAAK